MKLDITHGLPLETMRLKKQAQHNKAEAAKFASSPELPVLSSLSGQQTDTFVRTAPVKGKHAAQSPISLRFGNSSDDVTLMDESTLDLDAGSVADNFRKALEKAQQEARSFGVLSLERLLLTLMTDDTTKRAARKVLVEDLGIAPDKFLSALRSEVNREDRVSNEQLQADRDPYLGVGLIEVLNLCRQLMEEGEVKLNATLFLKAVASLENVPVNKTMQLLSANNVLPELELPDDENPDIKDYLNDLTFKYELGKMPPSVGRTDELQKMIDILSNQMKPNPILVGKPGVGKTAIVERLTELLATSFSEFGGEIPPSLIQRDENGDPVLAPTGELDTSGEPVMKPLAKRVYEVNFSVILADRINGEKILNALMKVMTELKNQAIFFIDEIHLINDKNGFNNFGNQMKPALARGDFQVIGSTTEAEFKTNIEADKALQRRFPKVNIDEPDIPLAITMLRSMAAFFEDKHGVEIRDDALPLLVKKAKRAMQGKQLPDSAIEVLDSACSRVKNEAAIGDYEKVKVSSDLQQLEINIKALERGNKQIDHAIDRLTKQIGELSVDDEHDAEVKEKEQSEGSDASVSRESVSKLESKVAGLQSRKQNRIDELGIKKAQREELQSRLFDDDKRPMVDLDDVLKSLSMLSGVNVNSLGTDEKERLNNLEDDLKKHIIGQDYAVRKVSEGIIKNRLEEPNKPASFLFLGPTGVGKTELAKAVAREVFEDEEKMEVFDMSEYQEKHNVARLIGSPPGYVGFDAGGQLIEAVKKNPQTVLLFDEIEKAHPDVLKVFLQVLEEGRITSGQGETVSLKDCVVIMTSNAGSPELIQYFKDRGAPKQANSRAFQRVYQEMAELAEYELKNHPSFADKPEFVNRYSAVMAFHPMLADHVRDVIKLKINGLNKKYANDDIKIKIELEPEALELLVQEGTNFEMGARPAIRLIDDTIVANINKFKLKGSLDNSGVNLPRDGSTFEFKVSKELLEEWIEASQSTGVSFVPPSSNDDDVIDVDAEEVSSGASDLELPIDDSDKEV